MNEHEAIRLLTEGAAAPPWLGLGPGDDTALLEPPSGRLLWTTDLQAEGVHFRRDWIPLRLAARRALAVNLSDLASMGGSPVAYLLTAGLPPGAAPDELQEVARGLREGETRWGLALAGGHTFLHREGWMLSVSLLGAAPETPVLTRSGASAGDALFVSGPLGGAARGLQLLQGGEAEGRDSGEEDALRRFREPEPRLDLGAELSARGATACLDLSDGLGRSLHLLAAASRVGIHVDETALPCHPSAAPLDGEERLRLLLGGGEEYELIAAGPEELAATGCVRIGTVVPEGGGVSLRRAGGGEDPLPPLGHDHLGGTG